MNADNSPEAKNRFTDRATKYENTGFVKRNLFPSFSQVGTLFVVLIIFFVVLINNTYLVGGNLVVSILTSCLAVGLGLFLYRALLKTYDVLTANEFQNAIFAGSTGAGAEFTMIVRNDNTVAYCNPGYYKYFSNSIRSGVTDLRGMLKSARINDDQIARLIEAMSKNNSIKINVELDDLNGDTHHLTLSLEPIRRPRGFFSLKAAHRNTDDIKVDEERSNLEKIFHDAAQMLPLGFYIIDRDGNFKFINTTFAKIFGYYENDILSKGVKFEELVFNLDKTDCDLSANWQGELTFFDKNNRLFKGELTHHVFLDKHGDVVSKYGVIRELTSIKGPSFSDFPANSSVLVDQTWDFFAENSPIPQLLVEGNGTIKMNNSAYRNMVRSLELQNTGKNLLDIFDDENRAEVAALLKDIVTSGHITKPISVKVSGNSNITAALYISHLPKIDGVTPGYLCNLIDTTEQKNLEQRFVHSQKMQAVGQLAGGIAHDFNNLLTAMTGFCDLLLIRHPSGDPSFADIMQIKQNSNRAANLVRQLLAFSRKQTMQPEVINITDVLAELSNLIRRLIGENIELKMNHGRNLWNVRVDHGQFEQVVINLAVNARDAMTNGGVLAIETSNVNIKNNKNLPNGFISPTEEEVITPGEYVLIEITDSGTGIPKDILGKIFEPFFSTKEIGQGTGLGLSTVYGIIKQTGGFIYLKSDMGKGTTFAIYLKKHTGEEKPVDKTKVDDSEKTPSRDLTGVETILLVEDEDPVRVFSARALRNKGYSVLEADSGEAALEIVNKQGDEINVIVTDVVMPGINGPAMIEEVLKTYPTIKVIFISGYAEDTFMKTYGNERKFNFLPKPFTLKQLAGKVKEVIDRG